MPLLNLRRLLFATLIGSPIILFVVYKEIVNKTPCCANFISWKNGEYPIIESGDDTNFTGILAHVPTILFWTNIVKRHGNFDDLPDSYYSDKELNCSSKIAGRRCFFTHNRAFLSNADVVFLSIQQWLEKYAPFEKPFDYSFMNHPFSVLQYLSIPPKNRPQNQYWIFYEIEAPPHLYHFDWKIGTFCPKKLRNLKSAFNWTMTYRLDSTIPSPYGRFEPLETPDYSRIFDRFANKTAQAVYMASYCGNRMSHRDEYVRALIGAGLDVEMIGTCDTSGKNSPLMDDPMCERTPVWSTSEKCVEKIGTRYKFYLAFENSLCQDYVTEKFYRAASTDLIPVVLNGANMALIAPPHSYIDAKDFETPRELAVFLKKTAENATLYNSYFWWKPYYDVVQMMEGMTYKRKLCQLCDETHILLAQSKPAQIGDIEDWWVDKGRCVEGQKEWPS